MQSCNGGLWLAPGVSRHTGQRKKAGPQKQYIQFKMKEKTEENSDILLRKFAE